MEGNTNRTEKQTTAGIAENTPKTDQRKWTNMKECLEAKVKPHMAGISSSLRKAKLSDEVWLYDNNPTTIILLCAEEMPCVLK